MLWTPRYSTTYWRSRWDYKFKIFVYWGLILEKNKTPTHEYFILYYKTTLRVVLRVTIGFVTRALVSYLCYEFFEFVILSPSKKLYYILFCNSGLLQSFLIKRKVTCERTVWSGVNGWFQWRMIVDWNPIWTPTFLRRKMGVWMDSWDFSSSFS